MRIKQAKKPKPTTDTTPLADAGTIFLLKKISNEDVFEQAIEIWF